MAGRKLTDAERENFAARNAASKAITAKEKAKQSGVNPDKIKAKGVRTAAEIDADIAKAKADPKFMAKQKQYAEAMKAKGTQKGHAVTDGDNHTRLIRGRGGSMGAVGRIGGDFLDQTK